ncbi:Riboflavin biosynthesis protein RibF [Rhodoplanes serenus]|uniref:Riboflavin biosynthesis protein n=1 Tax=Rhodoplanes serenus TaxID=200615 RepID=A0A3S4B3S8_9BRAD|nr:bifunctional riboflavin kinase/FAD synthetase [Rhodoplanes serenus]MBI5114523.1 bifunctional riboflavin kinase/FAD synthetase [Rhodovulum sp.]VCU10962.1 Riboflavin biosynthesis protein RibF [Rhodoplanes serenus]
MTDISYPATSFRIVRDRLGEPAPDALAGAVVALGNFDGVHRGHRAVIAAAQARAHALGRPAAAMTFEPHPRAVFDPETPEFRLSSLDGKVRLLAATGLDGAIVMGFDKALASLSAADFVAKILVERYKVAGVAAGFDFQFGKNRAGTTEFLTKEGGRLGFTVDIAPPLLDAGERVSSGAVRSALTRGEVEHAWRLLGYPWFQSGIVVHGASRGRDLGYPTANIQLDPNCKLRHGVYAVRVGVDGRRYDGVANFGRRPMFDTGVVLLEAFLFDFKGDLYGKTLDVAFYAFLRPELKFRSTADLVDRMNEDSKTARQILAGAGNAFPQLADVGVLKQG